MPMNRPRPTRLLLLAFGVLLIWSCGGDDTLTPETPQAVTVTVTTDGTDEDSDGYTVTLGNEERAVGPSGSVTFEGLTAGDYEVSLEGVAPNCTVTGGGTTTATVTQSQGAAVTFSVVCESVLATGAFADAICPDLSVPATSARPLERLSIGSVPEELEDPLFAYVTWAGGDDVAISFVDRAEDGSATLVAPYHPAGELGGGEVSIRIAGGTQACPVLGFDVDALPEAPDELANTIDLMQELIEAQAARVGVTVTELQALDGTTLPAAQVLPLLVAQSVIDHPDNPNSLRALVDGTAPTLDGADVDGADRVLAGTGFRQALQDALAEIGPAPGPLAGGAPARADALDCLVTDVSTAERLHECMELAYDAAFRIDGVSGEVLSDIGFAAGVVGQVRIPATQVAAYAVGGLAWAFQKLREGTAHLLPSEFVAMKLDAAPVDFLEDEEASGAWSAEVRATSKGWELDRAALEALSQIAGGLGAYDAWLNRFMGADEAVDLAGFVTGEVVSNAIAASGGAGILEIPPEEFGPVDVSDEEWSDYRLIPEAVIEMTTHTDYEPREHGSTTLSVRTKDGMFGSAQIAEPQEVTVGQIQINLLPDDITLAPGQDTMLTVTVVNAAHPDSIELDPDVELQGQAEISFGTANTHFVLYTAPQNPLPNTVDQVTATPRSRELEGTARTSGWISPPSASAPFASPPSLSVSTSEAHRSRSSSTRASKATPS